MLDRVITPRYSAFTMRTKKAAAPLVTVGFQCPTQLKEVIAEIARREGRTISGQVRFWLERELKQQGVVNPEGK